MRATRDAEYKSTSETVLVINSESRTSGSTQQYTVPINPPVHDIIEVQLLSFDGIVKPYNILTDQLYYIMYAVPTDPPSPSLTIATWTGYLPAGYWSLVQLLEFLNGNLYVQFRHDAISGKIIIEMTSNVVIGSATQFPWVWGNGAMVNSLLGFDSTFPITLPSPGPVYASSAQWQIYSDVPTNRAIQSVFPVSIAYKPRPIQLAFENIAGQLSSSNSIGGCFVVSVDPAGPLSNETIVSWKSNKDFKQITRANHIRLANIGIRLCDSIDGSPYKYPGEHTIILKVIWYNNK